MTAIWNIQFKMKILYLLRIALTLQSFLSIGSVSASQYYEFQNKIIYRLPTDVKPSLYVLEIKPYINKVPEGKKQFEFDGITEIVIKTEKDNVNEIVLHKKNINIWEESLEPQLGGEKIQIMGKHDIITDLYTLSLSQALDKNVDYKLTFKYIGQMADEFFGFYKSSCTNDKGDKVWIGTTQFEMHHARKAFPCFDEPSFKARFEITINHEKELTKVLSNMQITGSHVDPKDSNRWITIFDKSPIMSTYLNAFIVSNFDEVVHENFKNFGIVACPEHISHAKYALTETPKLVKAFDEYMKLPLYELGNNKIHMAAIPDYAFGGMENWGLITYQLNTLLYDEKEMTSSEQQFILTTIAHELGHMWFGNDVTIDWWSYFWLNEAFPTYFQFHITQKVQSSWELEKQFVTENMHVAFKHELNLNPMTSNVESPNSINMPLFATTAYQKGSSILRMFRYSMGENTFQAALQIYLKSKAYGSSKPDDLFIAFQTEWKPKDIDTLQFFRDWTEYKSYPVVYVKVVDDGKKIIVSQKRYLEENIDHKYIIPFTFTTQKNPNFTSPIPEQIIFFKDPKTITLPESSALSKSDYIIANIDQMGYYRVFYEENMLHNIHAALESKDFGKISDLNRAHLINDLFHFGNENSLNYKVIFDVLSYLKNEKSYIPWKAAFEGFQDIEIKLGNETGYLKKFLHIILQKIYDVLKFEESENEKRLDTYSRENVLKWACKYDFKDCNEQAAKLFNELKTEGKEINPNIRSVIYCSALRKADSLENYDFLEKRFIETIGVSEKTRLLTALGCVKKTDHIKKFYKFILSKNMNQNDKMMALNSLVAGNQENPENVFKLIKENPEEITFDERVSILFNIISRFEREDHKKLVEEVFAIFKNHPMYTLMLSEAISIIHQNIEWKKRYKQVIDKTKNDLPISNVKSGGLKSNFSVLLITSVIFWCNVIIN